MTATATEKVIELCELMRKQDAPDTQLVLVQLDDLEEVATKAKYWDKYIGINTIKQVLTEFCNRSSDV